MPGQPGARLNAPELAAAAPVSRVELERLVAHGLIRPDRQGLFAPTDIQRVRAVKAMLSPGISLDELLPPFEAGYFTLEPIEAMFPEPSPMTDQTFDQLAGSLGIPHADLSRIFLAAGFPMPAADEAVRADDAAIAADLVRAGQLFGGIQLAVRAARIIGDPARRAADAGLALFQEGDQRRGGDHRDLMRDQRRRDEMNARGAELMHLSEKLMAALFARHLEHALVRLWANAAEHWLEAMGIRALSVEPPGIAFVDLAGYTALTEAAGDATAAQLAARLAEESEAAAARHGGRVIKLLGDGAMLYFARAHDAVRGALDLVDAIGASDLPPARGGAHTGPVIERDGDYFGRTVNTAARISAQAAPGQVLVSAELATAGAQGLRFASMGARELKGLGKLALFEASAA